VSFVITQVADCGGICDLRWVVLPSSFTDAAAFPLIVLIHGLYS
jgi:hypothetical protein